MSVSVYTRIATCTLMLGLTACAASPTEYYRLPNSVFQLPAATKPQAAVVVELADGINTDNLLYQTSSTQIHMAQSHLWAHDLRADLAKSLANELNRQNGRYAYTITPSAARATITIYIDAFQGHYDGYTQIAGHSQWQGNERGGNNFDVHTPQQGDGYAAMVQSLGQGLQAVATQIAR
ncbi:membrane integrity-associated transporter subunit PqiC [Snodgrassella sp. CFCC 13594]|uniref:PqiC family protein n=1 Tax=Snodgrassella sp. CFCC 13594 TaxID=1775559 RepID=UPI00082B36E6|nr:ABC-type transport auxiliary lipoprotein family protein [Snodgrassella sp. CFCC 13594]